MNADPAGIGAASPPPPRNRSAPHAAPTTGDVDCLRSRRRDRWGQTPDTRLQDPEAAARLIERVGLATLFPASPEVPNLFHAFVGDPAATTDSRHDGPSGEVYSWRWALGRKEAAFYTAIVRDRPTWVSWDLLPAVLRLRGETRSPRELHAAGQLSTAALRVARSLEESGGVLSTGELRKQAGFPTGKPERAAYLKAVAELDTRLLLAKVFAPDDLDMRHALVRTRYPEHVAQAGRLTREDALARLLAAYLPAAGYAVPKTLARHLGLPEPELRTGLDRLVANDHAVPVSLSGHDGDCYVWHGETGCLGNGGPSRQRTAP